MIPRDLVLQPESRHPLTLPKSTLESILSRPVPVSTQNAAASERKQPGTGSSIIVVSFNNLAFTRLCLESVLLNTPGSDFELIVVDNGSTDGSCEYLLELSRLNGSVRAHFNHENLGFARACNQGLAMAQNEILVILNNDTIVPPGWLAGLARGLLEPNTGMVGPVSNRCGNEAEVAVSYRTYGGMLNYAKQRSRVYAGQTESLRMLTMFCVAFPSKIYEQIGQLDESFEIGFFEDEDYSMRLTQAGYSLICLEDVFVHHFGQASFGKLAASGEYGELFHANRRRFESKWGIKWQPHAHRVKSGYQQLVSGIRTLIESRIPFDSTVVVASRGDEDLVTFTGRTGWHLPQEQDGTYSGHHPANGAEVIKAVEDCRQKGAGFFVLPASMFWWLQFYPELATHLAERHRLLADNEECLIFDLSGGLDERDCSVCGPDVSGHQGIDRLTRKLVTVIYLLEQADSGACDFLEALAERPMLPYRLLIIDDSQGTKDRNRWPQDLVERNSHVSLVKTARRIGLAAAARLGCMLAPGDVVLSRNSDKLSIGWLEKLCSYASDDGLMASAGDSEAVFITRKALRQAELKATECGSSWSEVISDFRQQFQSQGFNNHRYESQQQSRDELPGDGRPVILALVHSGKGGARFAVEDVLKGLSDSSRCLLLETGPEAWFLFEVFENNLRVIRRDRFSESWSIEAGMGEERSKALAHICSAFSVSIVNIHHLMGSGPEAIDLLSELGIPVVFSFHDQYVICPTAHLVDDKGNFCGGVCSEGSGACGLNPLYFSIMDSELKHGFVHTHRKRMEAALKKCQSYIVPSVTAKHRLTSVFDFLEFRHLEVIEHGRDLPVVQAASRPVPGEPARVVCLGSINLQKGANLIMALASLNDLHGRRFEFHFLGNRPPDFVPEKFNSVYHGSYSREGLQAMLQRIAPSFSLLAPICEETFSYTLSESWACGIPVFASNRGALRERITKHGGGWLFEPEDAGSFFGDMAGILDCPGEWDRQASLIRKIPLAGLDQECRQMKRHLDHVLVKSNSV